MFHSGGNLADRAEPTERGEEAAGRASLSEGKRTGDRQKERPDADHSTGQLQG